MCKKNIGLVNRTQHGTIRQCSSCLKFNITFNNIFLELSETELNNFKKYINQTDINYWNKEYGDLNSKAIPIPTMQHNLLLVFNRKEFSELKTLVNGKNNFHFDSLSFEDIEVSFCEN